MVPIGSLNLGYQLIYRVPYMDTDCANSPFWGSWKVTKLLRDTEAKVVLAQLEKWKK